MTANLPISFIHSLSIVPPMLSSSCVLLLFLLLPLSQLEAGYQCHELPTKTSFHSWKNCQYVNGKGIGNTTRYIVLNFSNRSEEEITQFFARPTEKNVTLHAGFFFVHNQQVETLNFGKVTRLYVNETLTRLGRQRDAVNVMKIGSNFNLRKIIFDVSDMDVGKYARFEILNNPVLEMDQNLYSWINNSANWTLSQILGPGECTFEVLPNQTKEQMLSDAKLERCKHISGGFYLENRTLQTSIWIDKSCLRLINVNVGKFYIKPEPTARRQSRYICKRGALSELRNNPHLCGDDVRRLVDYVQGETVLNTSFAPVKDLNFSVQVDENTCSRNCTQLQVENPYILCPTIEEDSDISNWFKYKGFKQKRDFLQSSSALINITDLSSRIAPELPNLKRVKYLHIVGNNFSSLELPSLESVESLVVRSNFNWFLPEFAKTFEKIKTVGPESFVECYIANRDTVADFRKIKLCTRVRGDLILTQLSDEYAPLFTVKRLYGCLTVRNTTLTSLSFLEKMEIYDCNEILVEDNPGLCVRGYLMDNSLVKKNNNKKEKDCPCILDDLAKSSSAPPANCSVTHVNKPFDCSLFDGSKLVEVKGNLILENCPNLSAALPKLEKITGEDEGAALIVRPSSGLPSIEFLSNLRLGFITRFKDKEEETVYIYINTTMTIEEYLRLKYSFGKEALLSAPVTVADTCYDLKGVRNGCRIFEGDLVVMEDELKDPSQLETITGCLIVQNGTQLNFLRELKDVGTTCFYQNGALFPYSPGQGHEKTTISQMKAGFCLARKERERLALVTNHTVFQLSGQELKCPKSCEHLDDHGNCDAFHGNLVMRSDDNVLYLEVIYGSLVIDGLLKDTVEFPKLERISSLTAPALVIRNNVQLESLRLHRLPNISSADNGRPLIIITGNVELKNLSEFLQPALLRECSNRREALCYTDLFEQKQEEQKENRNWVDALILVGVLLLMVGIPVVYHYLTFEKREQALEKRREAIKERREKARQRREAKMMRSETSARAPTPQKLEEVSAVSKSEASVTAISGSSTRPSTEQTPASGEEQTSRQPIHSVNISTSDL